MSPHADANAAAEGWFSQRRLLSFCDFLILGGVLCALVIMPFERHTLSGLYVFTAVPLVGWAGRMLIRRRWEFAPTPVGWLVVAYLAAVALAIACSVDVGESFRLFRKGLLLCLVTFFVIATFFDDRRRIELLIVAFLIAGALSVLYGASNALLDWSAPAWENGRIQGTFYQPNRLAQFLLIFGSLLVALIASAPNFGAVLGYGALFLLTAFTLLMTYSRAGWAAFVPTMLVYGYRLSGRGRLAVGAVAAALVAALLIVPSTRERLFSSITADERKFTYRAGLEAWAEHPWFGVGYGDDVYKAVYESTYMPTEAFAVHAATHNIFLQAAVETGTVGLVAFLALHAVIGWQIVVTYRRARDPVLRWLLLWGLSSLVAVFTIGQLHTLYRDRNLHILWVVFGLMFAIRRIVDRESSRGPDKQLTIN